MTDTDTSRTSVSAPPKKLTDFKPIRKLSLPNLGELSCKGLIIIVGPNSSGKSQLLRDITSVIGGQPRELVVADEMEIEELDHSEFIRSLKNEGYITSFWGDDDQEQLVPRITWVGSGEGAQNVNAQQLEQWKQRASRATSKRRKNEYYGWMSKFLVTTLFLENRLTNLTTVQTINFEKDPPANDLHALHLNDEARAALTNETQRAFSKAVWSDISRGNQLCLRIAEDGNVPSAEARLSIREMQKYRTIESEGDGMKSYVATAISLLLGRRPVVVIDEPEMCLHPPQAFNLGQFIGTTATSEHTATFVATHSSAVLRGVIQTAERLQILRLTRANEVFAARHVDSDVLESAMKKPTVRAEAVLDGIFSQAVAIVEADGDRLVYHAAWEAVGQDRNFDIYFAAVGGTGGIADTCRLYKILHIPVAIIADLDVISDPDKLRQMLDVLCGEPAHVRNLVERTRQISQSILSLPPTIGAQEVRESLDEVNSKELNWSEGDDIEVRRQLLRLGSELNRMRRIKEGGVSALPAEIAAPLNELMSDFMRLGLFLVPVGELEGWLSDCELQASRRKKWAWANEAADYLRNNDKQKGDIWGFTHGVGDYLARHFE